MSLRPDNDINDLAIPGYDLDEELRLDALHPLRQLMHDEQGTSDSASDLQRVLPPQISSVLNQTVEFKFPLQPADGYQPQLILRLMSDATDGCGGLVWPAGQVRNIRLSRGIKHQLILQGTFRLDSGRVPCRSLLLVTTPQDGA